MTTEPTLNDIIMPHMGSMNSKEESHDLRSLSKRTCLHPDILAQLIDEEHLEPSSAVSPNTANSAVRFTGEDLDSLRFHALTEVVATIINALDDEGVDDDGQRLAAIQNGLREYVGQFASPFNRQATQFSARDEDAEGPGVLNTVGGTALVTGSVAAGLWARAKYAQKHGVLPRTNGQYAERTAWNTIRQGAGLAAGDAGRGASAIGQYGRKAIGALRTT